MGHLGDHSFKILQKDEKAKDIIEIVFFLLKWTS